MRLTTSVAPRPHAPAARAIPAAGDGALLDSSEDSHRGFFPGLASPSPLAMELGGVNVGDRARLRRAMASLMAGLTLSTLGCG